MKKRRKESMHQHGGDIYSNKVKLDFSSNVNLMGIPEGVIKAAKKGVDLSYRYPDFECNELREGISIREGVSKEMIICGNGAADLIFSLVVTVKPKKALLLSPTFYEYEQALLSVDCQITYHQLEEEDGFLLKSNFIEEINPDMDIVFICNPNNPTGALIEKALMEAILHKCEDSNCILIVDECFMDFVPEEKEYTIKEYCKVSKHLFVLRAFTKLYAMPGLRLGFGLCSDALLINNMKKKSQPWSVSIPAQMAGVAALKELEYVKQSLEVIEREKAYLIHELEQLKLKVYGSKANYIFFHVRKENINHEYYKNITYDENGIAQVKNKHGYLYEKCLQEGILLRDCSNYRGLTAGYYRIVVKTHDDNKMLIEILKKCVPEVE